MLLVEHFTDILCQLRMSLYFTPHFFLLGLLGDFIDQVLVLIVAVRFRVLYIHFSRCYVDLHAKGQPPSCQEKDRNLSPSGTIIAADLLWSLYLVRSRTFLGNASGEP